MLGSKVAEYYKPKVKSSFFLIPALFNSVGSTIMILAVNIPTPLWLNCIFIIATETCLWAYIGPINAITMTMIPPRLRSRFNGARIMCETVFGSLIASPIIGAISDSTGSLKTALQISWIVSFLGGISWLCGYFLLPPLPVSSATTIEDELLASVDPERN